MYLQCPLGSFVCSSKLLESLPSMHHGLSRSSHDNYSGISAEHGLVDLHVMESDTVPG